MVKGKTVDGFKFSVDEDILEDFMFLKYINMAQSDDYSEALDGTIKLVSCIFNNDEKERDFYEFLKAKHNGRVPVPVPQGFRSPRLFVRRARYHHFLTVRGQERDVA